MTTDPQVRDEGTAEAAKAPRHWIAMYGTTRVLEKPPHTARLTVTAGFKCAPLSAPHK